MANRFEGRGNLGNDPVLKYVDVANEKRAVCELRIYFDRQVQDGDDYREQGSFWLNVAYWGKRAETASKLLAKGCRVLVTGTLVNEEWTDRDSGEERSRLMLNASSVDLDMIRITAVRFTDRKGEE